MITSIVQRPFVSWVTSNRKSLILHLESYSLYIYIYIFIQIEGEEKRIKSKGIAWINYNLKLTRNYIPTFLMTNQMMKCISFLLVPRISC